MSTYIAFQEQVEGFGRISFPIFGPTLNLHVAVATLIAQQVVQVDNALRWFYLEADVLSLSEQYWFIQAVEDVAYLVHLVDGTHTTIYIESYDCWAANRFGFWNSKFWLEKYLRILKDTKIF